MNSTSSHSLSMVDRGSINITGVVKINDNRQINIITGENS